MPKFYDPKSLRIRIQGEAYSCIGYDEMEHVNDAWRRMMLGKEHADYCARLMPVSGYDNDEGSNDMTAVDATIAERATTHGNYEDTARIAQEIKDALSDGDAGLKPDELESLDLIATKMARIVSGGSHAEHWHDIAGYATLIEKRLKKDAERGANIKPLGHDLHVTFVGRPYFGEVK